ncbi:MAG: hypothetical protein HFI34_12460 [Lachnospiraceae bacterium]|nr:hypothetical protein [Lachnospiraceae bacterium]
MERVRFIENVIEKLGAVCVGETEEKDSFPLDLPENELVLEVKPERYLISTKRKRN